MLEIVIIGTRYFPFPIIIPCPIPPHKWEWVFFQSFFVVFFSLPSTESFTAGKER